MWLKKDVHVCDKPNPVGALREFRQHVHLYDFKTGVASHNYRSLRITYHKLPGSCVVSMHIHSRVSSWSGSAGTGAALVSPSQCPHPCQPMRLYTPSGCAGMSAGHSPALTHSRHLVLPGRLRERAYSSAFLKGRNSLLGALAVPSQCPNPCHPASVYVSCGAAGTLTGRAPLFANSTQSRLVCSPRERAYISALLNDKNLPFPGTGEASGTGEACGVVMDFGFLTKPPDLVPAAGCRSSERGASVYPPTHGDLRMYRPFVPFFFLLRSICTQCTTSICTQCTTCGVGFRYVYQCTTCGVEFRYLYQCTTCGGGSDTYINARRVAGVQILISMHDVWRAHSLHAI